MPQTAFYRLLIRQYAGAEVMNSPLFGIGLRDWARMPGMVGSAACAIHRRGTGAGRRSLYAAHLRGPGREERQLQAVVCDAGAGAKCYE